MATYRVEAVLEVTDEMVETLVEMAGYYIDYWAMSAEIDEDRKEYKVYLLPEFAEDGEPGYALSYRRLAEALGQVAFTEPPLASRYIVEYARKAVIEQDAGEIDSELADVVVQVAAFGEVVYG